MAPFIPDVADYQTEDTVYHGFGAQPFPSSYRQNPILPGVSDLGFGFGFDLPPLTPATEENRCYPVSILEGHSLSQPAPTFNPPDLQFNLPTEFPSRAVHPDPASALDSYSLLQPEHINPGIPPVAVEVPAFDLVSMATPSEMHRCYPEAPALETTTSASFPWPMTPKCQSVFDYPTPFESAGARVPFPGMTKATGSRQWVVKKLTQKTRRKNLKEEDRYRALHQDPYVTKFTTTKVLCSGCDQVTRLDSRKGARYYLHAWRNHKSICSGIEFGIDRRRRAQMETDARR